MEIHPAKSEHVDGGCSSKLWNTDKSQLTLLVIDGLIDVSMDERLGSLC